MIDALNAAEAEVWRLYDAALAAAQTQARAWFSSTDEARANLANVEALGVQIDRWSTARRAWALAGRRDDGSAYSLERWMAEGRTYAESAAFYADLAPRLSVFAAPLEAVRETAREVQELGAKVGAAAQNVGGGLVALLPYAPYLLAGAALLVAAGYLLPAARKVASP